MPKQATPISDFPLQALKKHFTKVKKQVLLSDMSHLLLSHNELLSEVKC